MLKKLTKQILLMIFVVNITLCKNVVIKNIYRSRLLLLNVEHIKGCTVFCFNSKNINSTCQVTTLKRMPAFENEDLEIRPTSQPNISKRVARNVDLLCSRE